MKSFFNVKTCDQVFSIIDGFHPSGEEAVPLDDACGRVLSRDVTSPEEMPGFFRSVMDGFAVKAKDTFGASESLPALLELSGEIPMGSDPGAHLSMGEALEISTGGMLPPGADGVVMKEYCTRLDETSLEVNRAISPFENVIRPGDDYQYQELMLRKGRRLRPQDVGAMAGLGIPRVWVFRKPKVSIVSTGDELVPMNRPPGPGQVRDINRYTLAAICRSLGAEPIFAGICPDEASKLKEITESSLASSDTVWLSGGSSVGTRDLTLRVFESLPDFTLHVHGISVSPGKPTIIGSSGPKPVIGLPGQVTSALVVAEIFLTRLLHRLSGLTGAEVDIRPAVTAEMSRNVESKSGREDYIRVKLHTTEKGSLLAEPVFGKSGLISPLVEADGLVRIGKNREGLYEGETVRVIFLRGS